MNKMINLADKVMIRPEEVLEFWLDELSPQDWYVGGDALDAKIRDRFLDGWQNAMDAKFGMWLTYPTGALAYIILTDQLPRNMHRGGRGSFASDHLARAAARMAIKQNWDQKIDGAAQQFFYMPFMHSESLTDQERCVRLVKTRMAQPNTSTLTHARAHREVIRQFGRFPARNEALGRRSTSSELAYLAAGGYSLTMQDIAA